ncbi:PDZ domain-containing protein [Chloroflexia bacterium SDU3-3]|nr:PDZ domain-containing protein [Chloroflexia bacterium SDU3-3]
MKMERRSRVIVGVMLVFALLVGVVAGGIIGGGVGYMVASRADTPASVASAPVLGEPVSSTSSSAATGAITSDAAVTAVVGRVSPAVVTVVNTLKASAQSNSQQELPFPFEIPGQGDGNGNGDGQQPQEQPSQRASGSGVIISDKGYIITNNHVVDGEKSLAVYYADGTRHDAKLVGTDPLMDIAVLQVADKVPAYVPLADSDKIQPGQTAIAIGSPLGDFRNSVTVGVVSALNRQVSSMEGLIQTDAAINHGNSGGPLLNLQGEVIGINTLVVRGSGITSDQAEGLGFSVPSNVVKMVSDQLIASGKVTYPFLGVSYVQIDAESAVDQDLPVQNGALVKNSQGNGSAVTAGSAADKAGIKDGDIITAVNGVKVGIDKSLRQILLQHKPGDTVQVEILRGKETLTLDVTLGERPADLQ